MTDRLPPHSLEAEEAVLGGIIIDPPALYEVAFLEPQHFFRVKNREIFAAMRKLVDEGKPLDFVLLDEELGHEDTPYLVGLMNAVPTAIQTRHYGQVVWELAKRRELISAAGKMADIGYGDDDIDTALDKAQALVLDVTADSLSDGPRSVSEGFPALLDTIMARRAKISAGDEIYIPTSLADVDRKLGGGLEGSVLYVIAGRPGMGKSMWENVVRLHTAKRGGVVLAFNFEMSEGQLLTRMLATESGIDSDKIRNADFDDAQMALLGKHMDYLRTLPIWISDYSGTTITQMHAAARRIQAQHGLSLITVDYLQLIPSHTQYNSRVSEVGAISRGLKGLAKDLDVPVLALAQLSRSCENRQDKRPVLSDLRDSGDIEQDADVVMFLYRDGYYNDNLMPQEKAVAELNIAKNRHGESGVARLYYDPAHARFANLDLKTEVVL